MKYLLRIKCNEFTTSYRGFNIKKLQNFNLDMVKTKGYSFLWEQSMKLPNKNIL